MIIEKLPDRWILESITKNDIDFIHEFFNVDKCTIIHLPRKVAITKEDRKKRLNEAIVKKLRLISFDTGIPLSTLIEMWLNGYEVKKLEG